MNFKLFLLMLCVVQIFAQDPEEPPEPPPEPPEPPPEPPGPPNLCDGLSNIFVNDPSSCAGFFFCANGQSIGGSCQAGFFFNEVEQLCDFAENVPCVDCPPLGLHLKPVPQSCTAFVLCFNGVSTEQECAEDLYFDPTLEACNIRSKVDCPYSLCPAVDPPTLILIPSIESCALYYICSGGDAIQQSCAPGLHWNAAISRCDQPENANCLLDETPPIDPVDPPIDPPPPVEDVCPADDPEISFVAHPTSCTQYFVCLNGDSIMLTCAPGLEFDAIGLECNTPEIAMCDREG